MTYRINVKGNKEKDREQKYKRDSVVYIMFFVNLNNNNNTKIYRKSETLCLFLVYFCACLRVTYVCLINISHSFIYSINHDRHLCSVVGENNTPVNVGFCRAMPAAILLDWLAADS